MQTQAEKVQCNKYSLLEEKLKEKREKELQKKEIKINSYTDDQVTQELKNKGLPVFGTRNEKLDRLKKAHGILFDIDQKVFKSASKNRFSLLPIKMWKWKIKTKVGRKGCRNLMWFIRQNRWRRKERKEGNRWRK